VNEIQALRGNLIPLGGYRSRLSKNYRKLRSLANISTNKPEPTSRIKVQISSGDFIKATKTKIMRRP
jgi:hypothetical protein